VSGLAEGLTLAKQAGIDQLLALEVLKKSAAFSKAMDQKGYRMVHREFLSCHWSHDNTLQSVQAHRFLMLLKLHCPSSVISFTPQALASEMSKRPGDRDSSAIICFYDHLIK
jgi:3-hydroxyisobutyrate dehydrogenase-like beta-hydroxyacid dehydrogenase